MSSDVLGAGFRFPLLPNGGFALLSGAAVVAQALRAILLTNPGERIGRPSYGAGLSRFLFAPNTVTTRAMIQESVTRAIQRDEPRVVLLGVEVRPVGAEPTRIDVDVRYAVIGQNVALNLVYPYYLQSGKT